MVLGIPSFKDLLYLLSFCLMASLVHADTGKPISSRGILDLREYDFYATGSLRLNGEWVFYWQSLHRQTPSTPSEGEWINLPREWDGYNWKGQVLPADGFATFHLKIILPEGQHFLSLEIPYVYSAYVLYLDSIQIASNGRVGTNTESHISEFLPKVVNFQTVRDTVNLVMQVSNFEDRRGGIWETPRLGLTEDVLLTKSTNLALEFFMIGALMIIGLYQIGVYFLRKQVLPSLYFGIFCLLLGIRTLFVNSIYINVILPNVSWLWLARFEYIIFYIMPFLFIFYLDAQFPNNIKKRYIHAMAIIIGLTCILIMITDKKTFGYLLDYIYIQIILNAILGFVLLTSAIKKNERGSMVALFGIGILSLFIINDTLNSLEIIRTSNYLHYGMLFFVILQSLNIAYIFTKAFEEVQDLSSSLTQTIKSYCRFVPMSFLNYLGKDDITKIKLGDQIKADMTILFVDIRSFTTMSEAMSPQDNFNFINSYLNRISPVIREHGGFVDKFIGDAIMALFPNSPDNAVDAAIGILHVLETHNRYRLEKDRPPIRIGAGLHFGAVMLGTVGEKERMETTVISDAVNLASRLEGLAKLNDITLLTTLDTIERLHNKDKYTYRWINKGKVKGRRTPVTLVEIIDRKTDPDFDKKMCIKDDYQIAMNLYENGKYDKALQQFKRLIEILPNDPATENYIKRCQELIDGHGLKAWDGIDFLDFVKAKI